MAKHLTESCNACKPEKLLKLLEDSEAKKLRLTISLAAADVLVDDLTEENTKLKVDVEEATKQASDRLAENCALKAEEAAMKGYLKACNTRLAEIACEVKRLEEENLFLRGQDQAASSNSPKRRRQDEQQPTAPCNGER